MDARHDWIEQITRAEHEPAAEHAQVHALCAIAAAVGALAEAVTATGVMLADLVEQLGGARPEDD